MNHSLFFLTSFFLFPLSSFLMSVLIRCCCFFVCVFLNRGARNVCVLSCLSARWVRFSELTFFGSGQPPHGFASRSVSRWLCAFSSVRLRLPSLSIRPAFQQQKIPSCTFTVYQYKCVCVCVRTRCMCASTQRTQEQCDQTCEKKGNGVEGSDGKRCALSREVAYCCPFTYSPLSAFLVRAHTHTSKQNFVQTTCLRYHARPSGPGSLRHSVLVFPLLTCFSILFSQCFHLFFPSFLLFAFVVVCKTHTHIHAHLYTCIHALLTERSLVIAARLIAAFFF